MGDNTEQKDACWAVARNEAQRGPSGALSKSLFFLPAPPADVHNCSEASNAYSADFSCRSGSVANASATD